MVFKKFILISVILCSLELFTLIFLPDLVIEVVEMAGVGIIAFFLLLYFVYGETRPGKMRFTLPIVLVLISVVFSMIGAYMFQEQSFSSTLIAQRVLYYYLVYFLLHYLKVPLEYIIKTIVVLAIVYMVIYVAQYLVYPTALIKSKMFMDRGTLRIFMPGAGFLVIAYFIWLYSFFNTYKFKYILLLLAAWIVFVLLGTRQVIGAVLLLSIIFMVQSKVVKSRFLFFALIALGLIPVYLIFQDIINAMFDLTVSQSNSAESGIRVRAARFFLTDFYKNDLAYFIGNGAPGSSGYGLRMVSISERYGYYRADIGLLGEYTKYGLLFVVGVFIILKRALTARLPENLMFIKYNFLGILLTLVTGGGAFGSNSINILINCMMFYMIDMYLNQKEEPDFQLSKLSTDSENT